MGMIWEPEGPSIIDYGTAPEIVACGLARVDVLGSVTRLAFYTDKIVTSESVPRSVREVICNIIIPTDAIGASIALTRATFGERLMVPTAGIVVRQLLL